MLDSFITILILSILIDLNINMMQISSNLHQKSKSSTAESFKSDSVKRNSLIFAIIMILLQVCFSVIYGFLINVQSIQFNTASCIITIAISILVVAGFGLVFGYTKRLIWSGIGFTFFITAFCIQAYPLVNDFWSKVGLQSNLTINFDVDNRMFNLFLTDRQTAIQGKNTFYGNSIINALKCALSVSVAWSALLGRAGHLQCLITSIFGVIGFQLNRQLIQQKQGRDTFGTFYIFTFGGFMGLGLGLLSAFRERKTTSKLSVFSMRNYIGSDQSSLYSLFGSLIIFALFPLLSYEFDSYSRYNSYSPYLNPLCVLAGMSAGAASSIIASLLINGQIIVRDATHGLIAGAIAVGASSLYISTPVYAFVAGAAGGIIQTFIQNFIERRAAAIKMVISTVSWSLFGLQGLIGAGFAAGWKAIYFSMTNGLTPQAKTFSQNSQFQFYGGLISAGVGLAFGLVAGLLVILVNIQKGKEYFQDGFYWFYNDGIRFDKAFEHKPPPIHLPDNTKDPKAPVIAPPPQSSESEPIQNLTADVYNFDFSETSEKIINQYAYL